MCYNFTTEQKLAKEAYDIALNEHNLHVDTLKRWDEPNTYNPHKLYGGTREAYINSEYTPGSEKLRKAKEFLISIGGTP
jgi:hypothetical protein